MDDTAVQVAAELRTIATWFDKDGPQNAKILSLAEQLDPAEEPEFVEPPVPAIQTTSPETNEFTGEKASK